MKTIIIYTIAAALAGATLVSCATTPSSNSFETAAFHQSTKTR
jgi:hypothetical protein